MLSAWAILSLCLSFSLYSPRSLIQSIVGSLVVPPLSLVSVAQQICRGPRAVRWCVALLRSV